MLISCPKCHSVYNISEDKIPENGKKFKCAECGEIWRVFPQDVSEAEIENSPQAQISVDDLESQRKKEEVNEMLNRLSQGTKNLFADNGEVKQMSVGQRIKHSFSNWLSSTAQIALILLLIIALGVIILYKHRYDIVNRLPNMQKIYDFWGIESVYKGKDIIFRDVQIHQIGENKVLVSGRIYNEGNYRVKLLPIKVTFINTDGQTEAEISEQLPQQLLQPGFSVLFNINADAKWSETTNVKLSMED
ncbi:MAG: zinc-ribbon domain-containing protein [Alphaproteobacteria bacterium]|nr:zinc-ribbon domain-containing protein [Alphaproteobacteria bacterium]